MPKASVTRQIAREKQKLIDFVLDIEKYPEFIPFCIDSKVYERNNKKDEIERVKFDERKQNLMEGKQEVNAVEFMTKQLDPITEKIVEQNNQN